MKRIQLALTVMAAILLAACGSKEQKTIVVGHFASAEDAPAYVTLADMETDEEVSVVVTDGTFMHEIASDKTTIYELTMVYGGRSMEKGFIPDCDTVRYEIGEQAEEFYSDPKSLNYKMEEFITFQQGVRMRAQTDPSCVSELIDYAQGMYEENKDNYIGFVGLMIASQDKSDEEWEEMASQLSPELQNKRMIVYKRKVIEAKKNAAVGAMFRDFEAALQPDGTTKRFSDYVGQGKYVLVDFWASWCGPCIRETPYIRAAYDKYNGERFQVLGIAVSDKPEDTQKAMNEHGIVWDVMNDTEDVAGELYGFNSIPTIMLFGPDGTLLVREGLRGDAILDSLAVYVK
ncbi:MAG: TlpA family protein disulfide reductase [Paludibacteraceae bacterium]|nr:TlpA family protein disulfide reductase [Paludibacteraceae bacterium]